MAISRSIDRPSPPGNGSAASSGGAAVQRSVDVATVAFVASAPATPTAAGAAGAAGSQTIRRMTTAGGGTGTDLESTNGNGNGDHGGHQSGRGTPMPSTTEVLDRVDEMMAHLEERILEELERRGGRFTGTF
jgi:hypothetical protein